MSAVRLENVSVSYQAGPRTQSVITDLNLSVGEREFLCIVGPSGCGKTTLLNVLAGFVAPHVGTVWIGDRQVLGPSPAVGYVFQSSTLFPWLTVAGNVAFGPELRRMRRRDITQRVGAVLERVGLATKEALLPHQLSGGMQQRVALARVLVNEPKLLLMDEPFAALDALTRRRMQGELLRLWHAQPMPVVFVTHSVDEALLLADRIVVMTARSGGVHTTIDLDLERPRSDENPRFREIRRGLDALLLAEPLTEN